ncbi:hypothetical protein B0H10DRAFT_2036792 [Mycena sp. CBHHK59/15]|nr:hypothetical protein B0H10DRAFT_2036792 [Mycena sp. CBHHK59/15]
MSSFDFPVLLFTSPPLGYESLDGEHQGGGVLTGLQALYSAGRPFFTRPALQDVVDQLNQLPIELDSTEDLPVFVIEALDGTRVEFSVNTGRPLPDSDWLGAPKNLELVIAKPFLNYYSIQHLVNGGHRNVKNSSVVYLPIQLVHSTVWRDKETKERVPLPSFTFEETGQLFQDQKGDFEANKVELSALISSHIPWDIRKIVAFACGTPSRKPTHVPSVVQHIVVLALKDIFIEKEGNTKQVLCFAQDPIYSVIDKQLLAQHNIACCDDPRGFLEVDKWSLVISIAPNIPVKQIITDLARPAVIIWGRISGESEYSTADMTDPESPRLLKMIEQGYTEFAFPNYADSFKSVVMYVRNSPSEERASSR